MHTWTFDKNSKLIRYYVWVWEASIRQLNFCKLFWGIVLSPIGLVAKFLIFILANTLGRLIKARSDSPPKTSEDLLDKLVKRIEKISGFFLNRPIIGKIIGRGFVGLWVAGLLTLLVLAFISHFWLTLLYIGGTLGVVALIAGILLIVAHFNKPFKRFGQFLYHGYKSVKTRTCPIIEVKDDRVRA